MSLASLTGTSHAHGTPIDGQSQQCTQYTIHLIGVKHLIILSWLETTSWLHTVCCGQGHGRHGGRDGLAQAEVLGPADPQGR